MRPARHSHIGQERYGDGTQNSSSGLNAHMEACAEAHRASFLLNEALHAMFRRWEVRHGFKPGAGKILLPAGYVPEGDRA